MNIKLSRGYFTPARFLIMILVLCCLSFVQCSKGDGIMAPIVPSGDSNLDISDAINSPILNRQEKPNRNAQTTLSGYHPQVSPFMPTNIYDEMHSALLIINGEEPFIDGQMEFLYTKPVVLAETNPPVIQFAFVASKNIITPDEIAIHFNGDDVSGDVEYCIHTDHYLNADYYIGSYRPDNYLDPLNNHQTDIFFSPEIGDPSQENFSFTVPEPEDVKIMDAMIKWDTVLNAPIMNELWTAISINKYVEIGDRLENFGNWIITYEDQSPLPAIQSIEKLYDIFYTITFVDDVLPDRQIEISFSPDEEVFSELILIDTPSGPSVRSGSLNGMEHQGPALIVLDNTCWNVLSLHH